MTDPRDLVREQEEAWDDLAEFWTKRFEPGGQERVGQLAELVDPKPGTNVLEIGCGSGRFARYAASKGAHVVATDVSTRFLEIARSQPSEGIEYVVLDATDRAAIEALGERRFHAAIAQMVFQSLPTLDPLAEGLARVLVRGGTFVVTVPHPCFPSALWAYSGGGAGAPVRAGYGLARRLPVPVRDRLRRWLLRRLRRRNTAYLTPRKVRLRLPGQPAEKTSYARPLHLLLEPFLRAGFAVDALRESTGGSPADPEFPGSLVVRFRLVEP